MSTNIPSDDIFTTLGAGDYKSGVLIYELLGIDDGDMVSPRMIAKIQQIAKFVSKTENPESLLRHLRRKNKTNMNQVDFVHDYISLHEEKQELAGQIDDIKEQIDPLAQKLQDINMQLQDFED